MISVSMITVAFSSATSILDAVKPVKSQTTPDVKHILVDGVSSGDTVQHDRECVSTKHVMISERHSEFYRAMKRRLRIGQFKPSSALMLAQ